MSSKSNKSDNPISAAWNSVKSVVPGPFGAIVLGSALTYGGGRLLWSPSVEVAKALFRYPGRKLMGMSDAEWEQHMDELRDSEEHKTKIPAYLAGITGLGLTALALRGNEDSNGLGTSWFPAPRPNDFQGTETYTPYIDKPASLQKTADLMDNNSFMSNIDFNRSMNANTTKQLFSNDPFLAQNDPYARNMGTAIVQNAAMNAGTNNITMGNIFDSAVDKFSDKLSFSGLAEVGAKSLVANCMSQLFTGALDTMVGLAPATQRNLIDAGTWAGAISAIMN